MVALKKGGSGCSEKLSEINLFPSFKAVVNFSRSSAFLAGNTWHAIQDRTQQQKDAEHIGSGILTGDMGAGCGFNSSFS